ncbi:right-handed parallel beta-helix repeat-containing protein [Cerasicoccus maritimus]|uniref:right-handed parallel beta-helix repeat-containing protein n=1 Tax=Cerasicoccus maritimus TaxID=490089 RepID=UPI0028525A6C|nr:right-handed parallel beta-helix repeat-containing protein [Cerasicoccus maritimus]
MISTVLAITANGELHKDTMDDLSGWISVNGSSPGQSSANLALSEIPYMVLNNGVAYVELPYTVSGDWTLRFSASHSTWQRGLYAAVLNASGTEGYGVLWNSSNSGQVNGEGVVSIRKFSLTTQPQWSDKGSELTTPTGSGHGAISTPMAEFELSWEASTGSISLRVNDQLIAQTVDTSHSSFRRIYLRGNTSSYFDNLRFQTSFEDPMVNLDNWSSVSGSSPSLNSANASLAVVPYLALNNGVVRAELGSTVTSNWTLRFRASHSTWQRGLYACVLNADGEEGYGVLWDSATSGQANGEGYVSIRKFSLSAEPAWSDKGSQLTTPTASSHNATTAPMALIELSWDASSSTLYLRINGQPIAQTVDSSFNSFSRVYLRGNTTSYFDDIILLRDTPPSAADISTAIDITAYGAVGDGMTDNLVAINSAIAAANSQGKALYVPPGVFNHSSNLLLDGASLFGHGYISVLAGTDPANSSVRLSGSHVFVRGCRLISPNSNQRLSTPQSASIHVWGATNYEISGCYIEDSASVGIISTNLTSSAGSIFDNWIWGTLADGIHLSRGANNIGIWNNRVRQSGDDMIAVVSYKDNPTICSDISIYANDVRYQSHGRGITCVGADNIDIDGNYIEGSAGSGIHIVSEGSRYLTYGVSHVSVLDNLVVGAAHSTSAHGAITLLGRSGHTVNDVVVDGNMIIDSKSRGIRILNESRNIAITNNVLNGAANSGIDSMGVLENITISNNEILDSDQYAIFNNADQALGYFQVENNQFSGVNVTGPENYVDALIIEPDATWSTVTISGNHFDNPGGSTVDRYMEIHFPTVTLSSNTTSTSAEIWVEGQGWVSP